MTSGQVIISTPKAVLATCFAKVELAFARQEHARNEAVVMLLERTLANLRTAVLLDRLPAFR